MIINNRLVVVGFGKAGQANAIGLKSLFSEVCYFDPNSTKGHYEESYLEEYKQIRKLQFLLETDSISTYYFICIADELDSQSSQEIDQIRTACSQLRNSKGVVVLRSTVLPHNISSLYFDYYLPEFLHENYAVDQVFYPNVFALGKRQQISIDDVLLTISKTASRVFVGTPEEVAFIKYFDNIWKACRVAIVNELGDSAIHSKLASLESIGRILSFIFKNEDYQKFGQAFGGSCLPKDISSYVNWAISNNSSVDVLRAAIASNQSHRNVPWHDDLPVYLSKT